MTPSTPFAAASQPLSLAPSSPKETTPNPRLSAAPRPPDLPGTDPNAPPPPQQRRCGLHSNGLAPPLKGAATPQRCLAVGSPQPAEGKGQTGTNSIVFYLGGGREGGAPVPSTASSPHSPPAHPHPVCVCVWAGMCRLAGGRAGTKHRVLEKSPLPEYCPVPLPKGDAQHWGGEGGWCCQGKHRLPECWGSWKLGVPRKTGGKVVLGKALGAVSTAPAGATDP